jgi:hypothetical protein
MSKELTTKTYKAKFNFTFSYPSLYAKSQFRYFSPLAHNSQLLAPDSITNIFSIIHAIKVNILNGPIGII